MSQLLQVRSGVEFWQCLNCGCIRRILPGDIASVFVVPPEFCSARCRRIYMNSERHREHELRDQMSFGEMADCA